MLCCFCCCCVVVFVVVAAASAAAAVVVRFYFAFVFEDGYTTLTIISRNDSYHSIIIYIRLSLGIYIQCKYKYEVLYFLMH